MARRRERSPRRPRISRRTSAFIALCAAVVALFSVLVSLQSVLYGTPAAPLVHPRRGSVRLSAAVDLAPPLGHRALHRRGARPSAHGRAGTGDPLPLALVRPRAPDVRPVRRCPHVPARRTARRLRTYPRGDRFSSRAAASSRHGGAAGVIRERHSRPHRDDGRRLRHVPHRGATSPDAPEWPPS